MSINAPGPNQPYLVILGITQDAGHPQAGCAKPCCAAAWLDPTLGHAIASLGLIDPVSGERWLLDASPDLPTQWAALNAMTHQAPDTPLSGVALTHAHIGHYAGLMYLGRESAASDRVPVYAMPRMRSFLSEHAPWEQLISLNNITPRPLVAGQACPLNHRLTLTPLEVPHRDEYSETVAFVIGGPNYRVLYMPDVDKWERLTPSIETLLSSVDLAFVDGTFYSGDELPERPLSEIPHPFVVESLLRFEPLAAAERDKVHFIHLNHTNPLLQSASDAHVAVKRAGLHVAREGAVFGI
jgi:pyrroloquinoline quinone biosynthesis protein B